MKVSVSVLKSTFFLQACQATELDVLIPLEFKASKLVLVGDPEQLPPTVISEVWKSAKLI